MGRRLPSLAALAALIVPVIAGMGWLAATGAPIAWIAVNGVALLLALVLAVLLPVPKDERRMAVLAATLVAGLFVAALAGTAVDGVRRWVSLGAVRLHVGYLLLPLLVALAPRLPSTPATATLVLALLATLLQPDRATTMALVAALAKLAHVRRDRASFVGLIFAIAGGSAALVAPDPLAPVQWVEGVQREAWQASPIAGLALTLATLCPLLLLRQAPVLAAFLVGAGLMAFAGPYPSILIGYGAAPILGFGLALAALRCQNQGR